MRYHLFKIFFLTVILYPFFSYAADTDNRGLLMMEKKNQPVFSSVHGKYYLLSIGIDNYINLPKRKTAVGDAKEFVRILTDIYGFDKERVIEIYDDKATEGNIISALMTIAKDIKPEDSLLIYYAGHGALDKTTKQGAWIPVNASPSDTKTWIANSTIKKYLIPDILKAKHILLISYPFFTGDFFTESAEKPQEITEAFVRNTFSKTSREAITSDNVGQMKDPEFSNHSLFSHLFLKALKENKESYLLPKSIFEKIKEGVSEEASQEVHYGIVQGAGGEDGGSFVFFRKESGDSKKLGKESETKKTLITLFKEREIEMTNIKNDRDNKRNKDIFEREKKLELLDKKISMLKKRSDLLGENASSNMRDVLSLTKERQKKELEEIKENGEKERIEWEKELEGFKTAASKEMAALLEKDIAKYRGLEKKGAKKKGGAEVWEKLLDKWEVKKSDISTGDAGALIDVVFEIYLMNGDSSQDEKIKLKKRLGIIVPR